MEKIGFNDGATQSDQYDETKSNVEKQGRNFNVKNKSKDLADVQDTHGSNLKIRKITGYKNFKNIEREIPSIVKWFKENNISTLLK